MWDPENGHPYIRYPGDAGRWRLRGLFARARHLALSSCRWRWRRPKPIGPRIAIGLTDRRRAGQVRSLVARALAERIRAIGFAVPAETVILLDRAITSGEASATSCLDIVASPDSSAKRYLIRIALEGDDGFRDLDEVIADLDHQVLNLYFHLSGAPIPRPDDRIACRIGEAGDWRLRLASPNGQPTRPQRAVGGVEGTERSNGSTG